jgi:hypothetical protein
LKLDGLELTSEEMDKLNACQDRFKGKHITTLFDTITPVLTHILRFSVCNEWLPELVFRAPGTKVTDKGSRDFYDADSLFEKEK